MAEKKVKSKLSTKKGKNIKAGHTSQQKPIISEETLPIIQPNKVEFLLGGLTVGSKVYAKGDICELPECVTLSQEEQFKRYKKVFYKPI